MHAATTAAHPMQPGQGQACSHVTADAAGLGCTPVCPGRKAGKPPGTVQTALTHELAQEGILPAVGCHDTPDVQGTR